MTTTPDSDTGPVVVLVPGAWTDAWIWRDTAARLRAAGCTVETPTLRGLQPGTSPVVAATVTLEDHVEDVLTLVDRLAPAPVVLVGHSYSGSVVGQVADRRPGTVHGSVHVGSFLPRDGRSLLDDWGDDPEARAAEKQQVRADGMLWAPPPAEMLETQPDLDRAQRAALANGFVAHPGRTVLEPARMHRPVTARPATYVADTAHDLPPELADGPPPGWQVEVVGGGHWSMLTRPDAVHAAVVTTVRAARHPADPRRP